jgi:molybdopterin/thiamine biosynthesis adenylyltransferase
MKGRNRKHFKVLLPSWIADSAYHGPLYGNDVEQTGIVNVIGTESGSWPLVGVLQPHHADAATQPSLLVGVRSQEGITFSRGDTQYAVERYSLVQNIFSRNTGILEVSTMLNRRVLIMGCGSVGSLVALELARAGVGHFLLVDHDVLEYHNLCRHQCGIQDVGSYKTMALAKRILDINPGAEVETRQTAVELVTQETFQTWCQPGDSLLVGCADSREADVYANRIAVTFRIPFLSIGFWERAFAGEIFYHLPDAGMPCYQCALGDGGDLNGRVTTNHRLYTEQEDLEKVRFEPGISVDIDFVTLVGVKLAIDLLNRHQEGYVPKLLDGLTQYTLVCNTNKPEIGGDMAEIFSHPLQVTTSLQVGFRKGCPPCRHE